MLVQELSILDRSSKVGRARAGPLDKTWGGCLFQPAGSPRITRRPYTKCGAGRTDPHNFKMYNFFSTPHIFFM